jgi:hypothetical protein
MVVIGARGVAGGACVDIGEACCDAPYDSGVWRLKYQFVCSCAGDIAPGWRRVSTANISHPRSPRRPET